MGVGALSGVFWCVGEAGGGAEDAAGVGAVEGAGFGGWVEELWFGEFVDGEVVDRFVGSYGGWGGGVVGCCWDHAVDCAGVGES